MKLFDKNFWRFTTQFLAVICVILATIMISLSYINKEKNVLPIDNYAKPVVAE